MHNIKTPQYLMSIVSDYLSDRTLIYDTNEKRKQYQATLRDEVKSLAYTADGTRANISRAKNYSSLHYEYQT